MDNVIGALILLVFGIVAALRKMSEERQMRQERERRMLAPEDEPERARKTVYSAEEPTAEELEAQRRAILERQRGEAVEPPFSRQGPLAPPPEVVEEAIREAREQFERARLEARRRAEEEARKRAAAIQRRQRAKQLEVVEEGPRPTPPTKAPRPALPRVPRRHPLFHGLGDVRRGIVVSEILGPPKGLQ